MIVARAASLPGWWPREEWWKDAEIIMLRHQLAVPERQRPRAPSRLTWLDRAWAAVAAHRLSVQEGRPLSERKLAETFGKTSRRWARSRMAEARGSSIAA